VEPVREAEGTAVESSETEVSEVQDDPVVKQDK